MKDAELRGKMLKAFYERRHNNQGWVPTSDMDFGVLLDRQMVGSVGRQLADASLIRWKPLVGAVEGFVVGMGQITALGVDVVEGTRPSPINIVLTNPAPPPARPAIMVKKEEAVVSETHEAEKKSEIFSLKPSFYGMSVDLKALYQRIKKTFQNEK